MLRFAKTSRNIRRRYHASEVILDAKRHVVEIEKITGQTAMIYKDLRLRALKEAPTAFGSTYLAESHLTDADWLNRVHNSNGQNSVLYIANYHGSAVGLAGGYLNEQNRQRAHLVSMWTASTHRKLGVGRLLVKTICEWATSCDANLLQLMVTSNNYAAISFYKRLGFNPTGYTEPYPNDSALIEHQMERQLP